MAAPPTPSAVPEVALLDPDGLDALIGVLRQRGHQVIGPTVAHGVIAYQAIEGAADLPTGVGDEQGPAHYRLRERDDEARFGYAAAPSSWKRHLQPPASPAWGARRDPDGTVEFRGPVEAAVKRALVGVRPCELAAIAVQDQVLTSSLDVAGASAPATSDRFVVAVNCGEPAGTCFCASMGSGPRARSGCDLALTEVLDGEGEPRYVVEVGSAAGGTVLADLPSQPADAQAIQAARDVTATAEQRMGRAMDAGDVHDLLLRNLDHPRWDDVAQRCLACGNCTMVCPTCFCSDEVELPALDGSTTSRERHWASCFARDFSYIHGGPVRPSVRARYRQWMTHKLATWWDQFGTSGCVGCGRCISWCPVGIDITEEVAAIRAGDGVVAAPRGERAEAEAQGAPA